jgi:hypothetical protein
LVAAGRPVFHGNDSTDFVRRASTYVDIFFVDIFFVDIFFYESQTPPLLWGGVSGNGRRTAGPDQTIGGEESFRRDGRARCDK